MRTSKLRFEKSNERFPRKRVTNGRTDVRTRLLRSPTTSSRDQLITSRLAESLDFRPFFSQRNCQNTDLNNQIM